MTPIGIALLRAIRIEQRPPAKGERSAAARMVSAGLLEEFGKYLRGDGIRGRMLRLTPAGEVAWAKLPKPRSLMLPGPGPQWDCVHESACLGAFTKDYPTAREAHCPPTCAHRKDVDRRVSGYGSSSLAEMQRFAEGSI